MYYYVTRRLNFNYDRCVNRQKKSMRSSTEAHFNRIHPFYFNFFFECVSVYVRCATNLLVCIL